MFKFIGFVLVIGFVMVLGSGSLLAAEANDALRHHFRSTEYFMHKQYYAVTLEFDKAIRLNPMKQYQAFQAPMFPLTYLLGVTNVENRAPRYEKPPLSVLRIAGEILAGTVGGFAGVVGPISVFSSGESEDWGGFFAVLCVVPITYPLGSAIGVYLVGNIGNETGSFLATLGGSILGFGVVIAGLAGAIAVEERTEDLLGIAIYTTAWAPTIGATIGLNLTRRYKSPPAAKTALINLIDGQISLAVPTIYLRPDSFDEGNLIQNVDLMKMSF